MRSCRGLTFPQRGLPLARKKPPVDTPLFSIGVAITYFTGTSKSLFSNIGEPFYKIGASPDVLFLTKRYPVSGARNRLSMLLHTKKGKKEIP